MTLHGRPALLWSAVLGLVAIVGSYGLACVFPFAAVAALAAATLDARRGLALIFATWAANQLVGFTLLSYPHDAQAYSWGGAILISTLAGFAASRSIAGPGLRSIGGLCASIIAYQALMFGWAVALDGLDSSTPAIVAQVALADLAWFLGLGTIYLLLVRTAPRLFTPATA